MLSSIVWSAAEPAFQSLLTRREVMLLVIRLPAIHVAFILHPLSCLARQYSHEKCSPLAVQALWQALLVSLRENDCSRNNVT